MQHTTLKKRLLSLALCLCMVLSYLPVTTGAEETETHAAAPVAEAPQEEVSTQDTGNTATLNGTEYATFAEAYAAAVDGDTITLNTDSTADCDIKKSITIELNGHTLKRAEDYELTFHQCSVTVKGPGNLRNIYATLESSLTLEEDPTIANFSAQGTVVIRKAHVTGRIDTIRNLTIYDGVFNSLQLYVDSKVTLYGGTYTSIATEDTWQCPPLCESITLGENCEFSPAVDLTGYAIENVSVIRVSPVTIGETGYDTLADAVAAAESGDTITVAKNTTNTETLTIPEGVTLKNADGAVLTNSGTLRFTRVASCALTELTNNGTLEVNSNIGTTSPTWADAIFFDHALYMNGGDVTDSGYSFWNFVLPTYCTAGEGYILYDGKGTNDSCDSDGNEIPGELGTIYLHNATLTTPDYTVIEPGSTGGDDSCALAIELPNVRIVFSGTNAISTGYSVVGISTIDTSGDLELVGRGENPTLTIGTGESTGANASSCAVRTRGRLTVTSGTVNVTTDTAYFAYVLYCVGGLSVASGATLNIAAGDATQLSIGALLMGDLDVSGTMNVESGAITGKNPSLGDSGSMGLIQIQTDEPITISGTGTFNGLAAHVNGYTFDVAITAYGNAVLGGDLDVDGVRQYIIQSAENDEKTETDGDDAEEAIIPTITFTVPTGTTLTLKDGAVLDIRDMTTETVSILGTIDATDGKILCDHDGRESEATCASRPVCTICKQEYGELGEHTFDDTGYHCTSCQKDYEAVIENHNGTTYYESATDALEKVSVSDTLTLLKSATLTRSVTAKEAEIGNQIKANSGVTLTIPNGLTLTATCKGTYSWIHCDVQATWGRDTTFGSAKELLKRSTLETPYSFRILRDVTLEEPVTVYGALNIAQNVTLTLRTTLTVFKSATLYNYSKVVLGEGGDLDMQGTGVCYDDATHLSENCKCRICKQATHVFDENNCCTVPGCGYQGYELWVDGVRVGNDNVSDITGNGTASYDPTTKTLTLSGMTFANGYSYGDSIRQARIYANDDLTIVLAPGTTNTFSGNNYDDAVVVDGTKEAPHNLTIRGTGSMKVDSLSKFLYTTYGNITIEDGNIDLTYTNQGILADNGNISVTGGDLDMSVSHDALKTENGNISLTGGRLALEGRDSSSAVIVCKGTWNLGGSVHLSVLGLTNVFAPTYSDANIDDGYSRTSGDGAFAQNHDVSGTYFEYVGAKHLTGKHIEGTQTHSLTCGCETPVTIAEAAPCEIDSANCQHPDTCTVCGAEYGELGEHTFDDTGYHCTICKKDFEAKITHNGETTYYESAADALEKAGSGVVVTLIKSATLTRSVTNKGAGIGETIKANSGVTLTIPEAYTLTTDLCRNDPSWLKAPARIQGNAMCVFGSLENILTLDREDGSMGVFLCQDTVMEEPATIHGTLYVYNTLTLRATLTIAEGAELANRAEIVLGEGGNLDLRGTGFCAEYAKHLNVACKCLVCGKTTHVFDENGACTKPGCGYQVYRLYVGGICVDNNNASDIFGNGTASFNPTTRTLTLKGATISDVYQGDTRENRARIYSQDDLNIVLASGTTNTLASDSGSGIVIGGTQENPHNLTISGTGSLTSESLKVFIRDSYGNVTIESGDLDIGATQGILTDYGNISVTGGNLDLSCGDSIFAAGHGAVSLTGGRIQVQARGSEDAAIVSRNGLTLGGSVHLSVDAQTPISGGGTAPSGYSRRTTTGDFTASHDFGNTGEASGSLMGAYFEYVGEDHLVGKHNEGTETHSLSCGCEAPVAVAEAVACDIAAATCQHPDMCTVCGAEYGEADDHEDSDKDHHCDNCGAEMSKCADTDKDHHCDICGTEMSKCVDTDKDHICDICGVEMSKCADGDKDHYCDICGEEVSQCVDADDDGFCDICQKKLSGWTRISGANRWETARQVAEELKKVQKTDKFQTILIASGDNYADAIVGGYLATVKNAPILLSYGGGGNYGYLDADNITYIRENLAEGGLVYILGGETAVPTSYETWLGECQISCKRLGGNNRFATNVEILKEAGVPAGSEILVCTGLSYADSLSASATGKPILFTGVINGKTYGVEESTLALFENCTFTIIGGENAVPSGIEETLKANSSSVNRLIGKNRLDTAVKVAEAYFTEPTNPKEVLLVSGGNFPDGLCGGILGCAMGVPVLQVMDGYENIPRDFLAGHGIRRMTVLGGKKAISDQSANEILP